jgi:hypothetical protein
MQTKVRTDLQNVRRQPLTTLVPKGTSSAAERLQQLATADNMPTPLPHATAAASSSLQRGNRGRLARLNMSL